MKRIPLSLAVVAIALLAVSCETLGLAPETVAEDWVDADAKTYAAVAPVLVELVNSECGPSEFAREQLEDLVGDWALRIRAHGGVAANVVPQTKAEE